MTTPAWRRRLSSRHPLRLRVLLLWAVVACAGASWLSVARLQQLHAAFETDARIVHRLLSQRVVQHDAILATLALLQPAAGESDNASGASPLPRLTSVYPQILAVLQRTAQRNWPADIRFAAGDGQGAARVLFDRVGTSPTPQVVVLSGGDAREIVRVSATGEVSRGQ